MIPWLTADTRFPPPETALREPNGLLAAGGDLSAERIVAAYRQGIFPWFNPGDPILWWSPDPRMVLFPSEIRVSRSLRRALKKPDHEVRADTAFQQVMAACAAPRDPHGGTWIVPAMIAAYCRLHERGLAHSIEIWRDGELVGGLYGVALGRVFYGESMFSRIPGASKMALVHLARQLARWNFGLIDCQMETAHLASLGARAIPRSTFLPQLAELVNCTGKDGIWRLDHDLAQ